MAEYNYSEAALIEQPAIKLFQSLGYSYLECFHEIYGTKGAIEINGLGKSYGTETLTVYKKHKTGKPPIETKKKFKGQDNSWKREWIDLIKAINQNKLPMSNQYESCEVMKTISYLYSL